MHLIGHTRTFSFVWDLTGIGAKNSCQELVPSFLLATTLGASPSGSSELLWIVDCLKHLWWTTRGECRICRGEMVIEIPGHDKIKRYKKIQKADTEPWRKTINQSFGWYGTIWLRHGDAQPCGRKPSVVFLRLPAQPHQRGNHGKRFGRDDTESLHLAGHPRICTMSQCQASECSRSRELKTQAPDLEVSNISFSSLPSQESCLCCQVWTDAIWVAALSWGAWGCFPELESRSSSSMPAATTSECPAGGHYLREAVAPDLVIQ